MSIRQATASDSAAIAALFDQYRVFYGKRSDPVLAHSFISERIQRKDSVIFLAEAAKADAGAPTAAGFVQLYPSFSSVSAARILVLNDLFVAQSHRQQGVARQLMQAAQAFAQHQGVQVLRLSTDKRNHQAQALYESLGWERDQTYFFYNFAVPPVGQPHPARQEADL